MSVSEERLQDFAKMIVEHDAFPDVVERIQGTLFKKWIKSDDDERKIIGDIANNLELFITEIRTIYESIDEDKQINEGE